MNEIGQINRCLTILDGEGKVQEVSLDSLHKDRILWGRDVDRNDIATASPMVSRMHGKFKITPQGLLDRKSRYRKHQWHVFRKCRRQAFYPERQRLCLPAGRGYAAGAAARRRAGGIHPFAVYGTCPGREMAEICNVSPNGVDWAWE